MIHTEVDRQFYLGVAGIRLWYAREPLPGAAPSPEFEFPELDQQASVQSLELVDTPGVAQVATPVVTGSVPVSPVPDQRGVQRIASLQALMGEKDGGGSENLPVQKAPADTGIPSGDLEAVAEPAAEPEVRADQRLSLNMRIFIGEGHILIADISRDASLGLQETLAGNILKSIGDVHLEPVKWVQWPVFNNRLVAGQGVDDLISLMKEILPASGSRKVIVLGSLGNHGWLAETLKRSPDIYFEYTLAELASNPGLKRSLWQKLRPSVSV
ncbi:2-isopropylmalate synthase [Marinobacter sp. F3R11]|uniref:2-isopropylmalate synthase n=1 Tax=Marinobacter sp. F3R11 TaxID=2267231 RepID=UPI000DE9BBE5|nr:2-isopropylmalate synthase [Marinobacter sp. F3R11]RBW49429.1 2-isopropylmalate synthase [Marinobacter sp. F3R11]